MIRAPRTVNKVWKALKSHIFHISVVVTPLAIIIGPLYFSWLQSRGRTDTVASNIAGYFQLTPALTNQLEALFGIPADITFKAFSIVALKALGVFAAIVFLYRVAGIALRKFMCRKNRTLETSLESSEELVSPAVALATPFILISFAWIVVSFSDYSQILAGVIISVLLVPAIIFTTLLRSENVRERLLKNSFGTMYRSLFYANAALALAIITIFAWHVLPWLHSEMAGLPRNMEEQAAARLQEAEPEKIRQEMIEFIEKKFAQDKRKSRVEAAQRLFALFNEMPKELGQRDRPFGNVHFLDRLDDARNIFFLSAVIIYIWAVIAAASMPRLLYGYWSDGWKGIVATAVEALKLGRSGLLAIPIAYGLDAIGVGWEKPLLWLYVFIPLSVLDGFMTAVKDNGIHSVVFIPGSKKFHRAKTCVALRKTDPDRIIEIPKPTALTLGISACSKCVQDEQYEGAKVEDREPQNKSQRAAEQITQADRTARFAGVSAA